MNRKNSTRAPSKARPDLPAAATDSTTPGAPTDADERPAAAAPSSPPQQRHARPAVQPAACSHRIRHTACAHRRRPTSQWRPHPANPPQPPPGAWPVRPAARPTAGAATHAGYRPMATPSQPARRAAGQCATRDLRSRLPHAAAHSATPGAPPMPTCSLQWPHPAPPAETTAGHAAHEACGGGRRFHHAEGDHRGRPTSRRRPHPTQPAGTTPRRAACAAPVGGGHSCAYVSRSSTLRTLPDTVIGKASRIFSRLGIL